MTQYNMLNVKPSNKLKSQLDKLKSGIKIGTEETLTLLSHLIGNSNDETNFPHYKFQRFVKRLQMVYQLV